MSRRREELEVRENFERIYRLTQSKVWRDIERTVCGCDYGGTSWTTRAQAERMGQLLNLRRDKHLLEIGAGSGWPALYLAGTSGCRATLIDVPLEGLRVAANRAAADGQISVVSITQADCIALPFAAERFDAISHSDVLCCLEAKLLALNESRRVIRSDGRMAFTVIHIARDASAAGKKQAREGGPTFVDAPDSYPEMLRQSGWEIAQYSDLTADYGKTAQRVLHEQEARSDQLGPLLGAHQFDEMLAKHRKTITAIDEGVLQRSRWVAVPARRFRP